MNPVRANPTFTIHCSPLTMRYPFAVIREAQWLIDNGKCMVNSKWQMVNASIGGLG